MAKKVVLVATVKPFAPEAVEGIKKLAEQAGYEFRLLEKYQDQNELIQAVKDVNALIVRSDKVTKEVIDAAPNLEIIVRAGAGYDNIDIQYAKEKGIVVMNTPGQNANAVAELAIGMMIYMARNKFNGKPGTELKGKTLGLLAFGNVARNVARIAKGIGMDIYAYDAFVPKEVIEQAGVKPVNSQEELFEKCQYVSLHLPLTEQTRKSIGYDLIIRMPKNATLVNTARAEIINEPELLKVFEERDDFKYLSDIKPVDEQTLKTLEEKFAGRFFFTPKKMGAQTREANINAGLAAIRQIIDYFEKGITRFQVNK